MPSCKCCGEDISQEQWNYCNLCGLCDTGKCQRPSAYHELQKAFNIALEENNRLRAKIAELAGGES